MNTISSGFILLRVGFIALLGLISPFGQSSMPVLPPLATTANTLLWVGDAGTNNWSVPENWHTIPGSNHASPQNGDTILFNSNGSSNNDLPGLTLYGIGCNASGMTINGSSLSISNKIEINIAGGGSVTITTPITLGGAIEMKVWDDDVLVLSGGIGGVGGSIQKTGAGTLTLSGASANTYSGGLTVSAGTLLLNKSAGVQAVTGPVVIGPGTLASRAIVRALQDNQLKSANTITMFGYSTFDVNGTKQLTGRLINEDTNCTLKLHGTVNPGELTIDLSVSPNAYTNLSCEFESQPTSKIFLVGTNKPQFFGQNATPYSGTIDNQSTSFYAKDFKTNGTVFWRAAGGGGIYGASSFGSVVVEGGWYSIQSQGTTQTGSLLVSGSDYFGLSFTSPAGPLITVSGPVVLNGGKADPCYWGLSNAPILGQTRTIINKESAGAINGAFPTLADGQQVYLKPCLYPSQDPTLLARISYQGGSDQPVIAGGNDLTITRLVPASLAELVVSPPKPGPGQAVVLQVRLTTTETTSLVPNQPISFYDGNTKIGEAALDSLGYATLGPVVLAYGSHSLQARLVGDWVYSDASSIPKEIIITANFHQFIPALTR